MAIGLGIHGEPGIDETASRPRTGLAELLVPRLLDEVPEASTSTGPGRAVLNGLGSLKYEEMFVVYRAHRRAAPRGRHRARRPARRRATARASTWPELLTDAVLARRRTRSTVGRPGRHARLPARIGHRCGRSRMPRQTPPRDGRRRAVDEASRAAAAIASRRGRDDRRDHRRACRRTRPPRLDRRRRRPRHRHAARIARRPRTRPSPSAMPEPERRRCSRAPPTRGRIAPAAPPAHCGASSSPRSAAKLGDEGRPSDADVAAGVAGGSPGRHGLRQGRGRRQDARRRARPVQR